MLNDPQGRQQPQGNLSATVSSAAIFIVIKSIIITIIIVIKIIKVWVLTVKAINLNNFKTQLINVKNNLSNLKTRIVIRETCYCPTK